MTIHELIKLAIKKLPLGNNTSPALDGEVLLSYVLDKSKEYLAANPKKNVDKKLEKKYLTLLNRRLLGWPVAYLVKEKEFYGLKFYVDKRVLIPRPETEGLVELVCSFLRSSKIVDTKDMGLNILDIGTGSGNIIISIAKSLRDAELNSGLLSRPLFFASDLSSKALLVAKKNAKLHKAKITFKQGYLLDPWKNKSFDILIANLPYLHRISDPSTKFEPKGALIADKKGLALYERLFKQIASNNSPQPPLILRGGVNKKPPLKIRGGGRRPVGLLPRFIFLEIGRDQGRLIKKLAKKFLPAYETKIYKDLFGRIRFTILSLSSRA